MTIQETIRMIVAENSGGIKFTKLVMMVVCEHLELTEQTENPDGILTTIINTMPDLKVLKYGWKMAEGHYREKIFVYTPMP